MKVKTNTTGQTERHTVEVKPQGSPNGLYILIGVGIVLLLVIAGNMLASGKPVATPTPLPTSVEQPTTPEPPAVRDTRDDNTNDADHGSAIINGDNNTTTIDNSNRPVTTVIHHHHHTTQPTPVVVTRTVYVKTERRRDNVPQHCNDSMAEHHRTVAAWYDELGR